MSTYFRPPSQYFILFVCVIAVALFHRLTNLDRQPSPAYQTSSTSARTQLQSKAIENSVRGSIGIDESRGDSVFVVVRQ